MLPLRRFDHVGITVADLDTVSAFFVGLGFEVEGHTFLEGDFLDTVIGSPNSRVEMVVLRPPGDGTRLELTRFTRPDRVPESPAAMATQPGLNNVSFEVQCLRAALDQLAADGYHLIGGVGEYENVWQMASVRGPEGIIVNLASAWTDASTTDCSVCCSTPARSGRQAGASDGSRNGSTPPHAGCSATAGGGPVWAADLLAVGHTVSGLSTAAS